MNPFAPGTKHNQPDLKGESAGFALFFSGCATKIDEKWDERHALRR